MSKKKVDELVSIFVTHDEEGLIDNIYSNEEDCVEATELGDEELKWDELRINEDDDPAYLLGTNIDEHKRAA